MKRLSRTAGHLGKKKDSFTLHITGITAVGGPLPNLYNCNGITLQLWRHGKFFKTTEAMLVGDGNASWSDTFDVPCTLYHGKPGKGYASKVFHVSLLARHGKRLREVARGEVDIRKYTVGPDATPRAQTVALELQCKGDTKAGSPVILRWHVEPEKTGDAMGGDDQSDDMSRADSVSTLASATVVGASEGDQDLHGFEPAISSISTVSRYEPALSPIASMKEGPTSPEMALEADCNGELLGRVTEDTAEHMDGDDEQTQAEVDSGVAVDTTPAGAFHADVMPAAQLNTPGPTEPPARGHLFSCADAAADAADATVGMPAVDAGATDPTVAVVHIGDVQGGISQVDSQLAIAASMETTLQSPIAADGEHRLQVKAGWLLKRAVSATLYKNWRKRYVVCNPTLNAVLWYKSPDQAEPQGKLELLNQKDTTCEITPASCTGGRAQLYIRVGRKELVLESVSKGDDELVEWHQVLQAVLKESPTADGAVEKKCVLL
eukprot:CAMPEP_0115889286 /NCGR_PEP_ID=MMETSP0287-20121206/32747_1 /TAXON_ID=412157 /ORGANISM="Chrysochromulina rotalis, Strain UIO044" /LENGTH=491 /DNA_ID=CAMNT_0003346001 /DNA_START=14 /DNA_END=1489 /DNA_ORIENTATION=-